MIPFLIFIPPGTPHKELLTWTFGTAIRALNLRHVQVADKENASFETIRMEKANIHSLLAQEHFSMASLLAIKPHFSAEGIIRTNGSDDELLTAFYLINCLQEYHSASVDELGRFKYKDSLQETFKNIETSFVTELFRRYFSKHLPHPLRNQVIESSRFFFSHDIDSLYGAFLQDGLAALKKGRFDVIFRLVLNTLFSRPDWFNIDQILKIDNDHDLRSTFFWIVNKGRINQNLTNADYSIHSAKVKDTIEQIRGNGSHLGLHKSLSSETFDQELKKLPVSAVVNRNHYLKFSLPDHFDALEVSSIKVDCSLGYAEQFGFRNSLSIPFVPFNLQAEKPYHFLEVPLNLMDGTFQKYLDLPGDKVSENMIRFIEQNKTNAVISVLWHNHFFSSYRFRGYFEPYVELLEYLKTNRFSAISPGQLYNKYYFSL
jgi:hypothetical protein